MEWITANKLTINFDPNKSSYCAFSPNNKKLPAIYKDSLEIGEAIIYLTKNLQHI